MSRSCGGREGAWVLGKGSGTEGELEPSTDETLLDFPVSRASAAAWRERHQQPLQGSQSRLCLADRLSETAFQPGAARRGHPLSGPFGSPVSPFCRGETGAREGEGQRRSGRAYTSGLENWWSVHAACCRGRLVGGPQDSTSHQPICFHSEGFQGPVTWGQGSPCSHMSKS